MTSTSNAFRRGTSGGSTAQPSPFAQNMVRSMTIDEMRHLHERALSEAESKRTELKLVLASRYRELVGSSDEVIKMKERANELRELVQALPSLIEKVAKPQEVPESEEKSAEHADVTTTHDDEVSKIRRDLTALPALVYRAVDKNDVYSAATKLIELFTLIASATDEYPLANELSLSPSNSTISLDPLLDIQIRMVYLQMQTLPNKLCRIALSVLGSSASYGKSIDSPARSGIKSASALAALDSLEIETRSDRSEWLLNKYFELKTRLLAALLGKLSNALPGTTGNLGTINVESVLANIILILQYDIVLHPYQIFVLRNFPSDSGVTAAEIMKTLPTFDREAVKAKCSKFLSTHLPLIRNSVKSILISIAGTTASALGQIRQSLYDKTDGVEAVQKLNDNEICTWEEAVDGLVDVRSTFSIASETTNDTNNQRFSLWSSLFSGTFSSLVHSLLTTAFQSVHTSVISSLQMSLSNAPPTSSILPHEAYRNTLKIVTNLDESLRKVSEDAHELLVHAEERVESERRLRQSLYVQTCEIMGRLICELRRLAFAVKGDSSDATKELIIGRLCYHLKFRLTSLPKLLSSEAAHTSFQTKIGMIRFDALQSSFELVDHDEDGLIMFEEAMEAAESAFAGTHFQGADMVRETLLLNTEGKELKTSGRGTGKDASSITLGELALLTARGLRHEKVGPESALGLIQQSLDGIVVGCFQKWSKSALYPALSTFDDSLSDYFYSLKTVEDAEWERIFGNATGTTGIDVGGNSKVVSPYLISIFLECACILNRNICPSDSFSLLPSKEYATCLGLDLDTRTNGATLKDFMRAVLFATMINCIISSIKRVMQETDLPVAGASSPGVVQLHGDLAFLLRCVNEADLKSFNISSNKCVEILESCAIDISSLLTKVKYVNYNEDSSAAKFDLIFRASELLLASLLGGDTRSSSSSDYVGSSSGGSASFHLPISSTKRFVLLPVQAERSLNEIQLRRQYTKEKEEVVDKQATSSGNVMTSGFGFFSSMLKKK